MIRITLKQFEGICEAHGRTVDESMGCVTRVAEGYIIVDEKHAAFPRASRGAGTELTRLLKRFGIEASSKCHCRDRAAMMNARGVEWCEQNIDQIVGWLREEANRRRLPFLDAAGRMLVRRAIRAARQHGGS